MQPGNPYPGNQYPGQQYPGQQPYPGQPYPGQPMPPPGYGAFPPQRGSTPIDFAALSTASSEPPVKQRRTRPVWLLIGLVLLVGGGWSLVHGILDVIDLNDKVVADAVARAQVNGENDIARFTATKSQAYTVYAIVHTSNSDFRDDIVSSTTCAIQFQDGTTASISGSRQSTSTNIGDTSSIGTFDAPEGPVAVQCRSGYGDRYDFVVSPGTNNIFGSVAYILVGAFVLVGAIPALIVGCFGGRRRARRMTPTIAI